MGRFQHPVEVHGVQKILDEGLDVKEMTLREILVEILMELKKINIHNEIITDEEILDEEVEDVDYS